MDKNERQRLRRRRRKLRRIYLHVRRAVVILILLLICFGIFSGIKAIVHAITGSSPKTEQTAQKKKKKAPSIDTSGVTVNEFTIKGKSNPSTTSLTISSMGDCTLGTDEHFDSSTSLPAYYNQYGADYFFKNVKSILEKDDLSIVNFEGTLTTETTRENKSYAFKAPPEYAQILSNNSVEAANTANNHSSDYGEQSYTDTIKNLTDAGIAPFGYDTVDIIKIGKIKVGLTGIYELNDHLDREEQVKQNIQALKEHGANLIIVNFHWGTEKETSPDTNQQTLAHLAVDQGADLVIGHHPHVLQGIEYYKGKSIVYSLGNFCFGGNSNPADKNTMIYQQTFSFKKGKVQKNAKENIIPCSISSTSVRNDYCPTPLEGDQNQALLDLIKNYNEAIANGEFKTPASDSSDSTSGTTDTTSDASSDAGSDSSTDSSPDSASDSSGSGTTDSTGTTDSSTDTVDGL